MVAPKVEKIARLAMELSVDERRELIQRIASSIESSKAPSTDRQSLRGILKDTFPDDFDLDAALHEIRHEWEAEIGPTFSGEGEIP